jgi:hypothetical protein
VPISKILKPVLNEHVTPVACYWSLALLLREEYELMLVFKVNFACFYYVLIKFIVRRQWSERACFAELESTCQDVGSYLESVMCIRRLQYSGQFCIASIHMNMLNKLVVVCCPDDTSNIWFAEDFAD